MFSTIRPTFRFALLCGSVVATPALARDASNESKPDDSGIVVYGSGTTRNTAATGLDLTPRETPQSLTIITREQMDDQAANTVADMLEYTTGLSVKRVDRGRNLLSARGFAITSFQLDGLPVATGNIGLEETSATIYDRIEVVRGAVGLLQGAGEPSASVNMVRKKAEARELTGAVTLEAASWDHFSATADVSTPLTSDGSVRFRFAGEVYTQDAFVDLETSKGFTLYGTLGVDLGPDTLLTLGGSYQKDQRDGVMWAQLPYWYSDGTVAKWSRSKTTGADWNAWETIERSAFLSIDHDFGGGWSLRAAANYNHQTEDSKLIWLWGNPDRVTGQGMEIEPYWYLTNPKQFVANLQLKGRYGLFGREHELVVGAMYSRMKTGWTNRGFDSATVQPVGDFGAWDGSYPEPAWGPRFRMSDFGTTKQTAVYGVTRLQILDSLKLIVGGRLSTWTRNEKEAFYTTEPYVLKKKNVITPYAGLIFDFTKTLSAYASYTSIFNPQTNRDRNGRYLDPLEGAHYEAGLKADLMGGRLRASAAVFRIEQDNFAVPDIVDGVSYFIPGTNDIASRPAMGTVSEGYELEVQGEPLPGWDISAGWSHFKAQDANDVDVQQHQPRKVFRMATKYEFGVFSLGGSARWESRPPQTAFNPETDVDEPVGQKAYWLVNLMGAYDFTRQLSLQVNLNNVFDKTYYNTNSWFGGYIYGEPRNVRVTLRYGF